MIATQHITRLLGDFMAPEPPPKDRREKQLRSTRQALLSFVTAQPKGYEEIAKEYGGIGHDTVPKIVVFRPLND